MVRTVFQVHAVVKSNEFMFITGDCENLGLWNPNSALLMKKSDDPTLWQIDVDVEPNTRYRYFIGSILKKIDDKKSIAGVVVKTWESNQFPRNLQTKTDCADIFGCYGNKNLISVGCLNEENAALVYLSQGCINWYIGTEPPSFNIKVYTLNCIEDDLDDLICTKFEIAALNHDDCEFRRQQPMGYPYNSDDAYLLKNYYIDGESGIRIDCIERETKNRFASAFLIFEDKYPNVSTIPIMDSNSMVIGKMKIEFLLVKPLKFGRFDLETGLCTKFISLMKEGINVGHRGSGVNRRDDVLLNRKLNIETLLGMKHANQKNIYRSDKLLENTISSLNYAIEHGADMVEFDVQLTKDHIPVLYHDYSITVSLAKKGDETNEFLELPVADLTYQQLKILKLNQTAERFTIVESDVDDNQPFCSLESVLKSVRPCAFNLEVKSFDESRGKFDPNDYVDRILKTLFEHAGERDIIISSFDPEVCAMVRLKQSRFPVLLLTEGDIEKSECKDGRTKTVKLSSFYANAMHFAGVNCDVKNLLKDKSTVKFVLQKNLLLFCYGELINEYPIIEELLKEGVHGLIYDKIDVISPKNFFNGIGNTSTVTASIVALQ